MKIEIEKELIPYSFEIELEEDLYLITVKYNEVYDFFTLDLNKNGEDIIYGQKVTLGVPLFLSQMYEGIPDVIPYDSTESIERVTFENFDETVELLYIKEGTDTDEILE